jgi:hypothetical protein
MAKVARGLGDGMVAPNCVLSLANRPERARAFLKPHSTVGTARPLDHGGMEERVLAPESHSPTSVYLKVGLAIPSLSFPFL